MKIVLLALALCLPVAAQSIPATTADGRKVILNTDGTWKYEATTTDAAITIEAALVYQNGSVKPVARTPLLLLDADPGPLLVKAGLKPPVNVSGFSPDLEMQLLIAFTRVTPDRYGCPECPTFLEAVNKALAPHVIKSTLTGFDGKTSFDAVKPGAYYLFGKWNLEKNAVLWSLKLDVKAGPLSLKLSQDNALFVF